MVDLGRFGCSCGVGSRKLPNSFMRHVGQVVAAKWAMKSIRTEFERMCETPLCLIP